MTDRHFHNAINLLRGLIGLISFSREEDETASIISKYLALNGVQGNRVKNNVYALNKHFDSSKPSILLNSHHDTVKPNTQYIRDPFDAAEEAGKLFGLGSNDAGGCLVSLIETFLYFYDQADLKYNLVLAATAEEEISGENGIECVLPFLPAIDFAIVGEPTKLQLAIAEKGLLVLDCIAHGKAGHAAREEGENAIYKAMKDIEWIRSYTFPRISDLLGPVKMSVTVIETDNKAHNVVPAECSFITDVRINELYTHEEVIETIRHNTASEVKPRSTRMRSTMIPLDHPLVKAGLSLGKTSFGSLTSSDKALMPFPALKVGPGDSARSHTANEFIFVDEIREGIEFYICMLKKVL